MKNTGKHLKKSAVMLFLAIALSMSLGACMFMDTINGSGDIVAEVYDLSDFDAISAGGSADVEITLGEIWRVELITDDNLHEYIDLYVEGRSLRIKNRDLVNLQPTEKVLVRIVMPAVYGLDVSGASTVRLQSEITQSELSVSASGSSDVHLHQVNLDKLSVSCSGSSDIYISGFARAVRVSASGSSDFRGKEFRCDEADVRLSGSSDMYAMIREEVTGSISGSSDLYISGSPHVKVSTSGSSDIRNF